MGTYIDTSDLNTKLGSYNIVALADNDADGSADTGRVADAIAYAESYFEARLKGGPYTIPLSFSSSGAQAHFDDMVCRLAVYQLYATKGLQEDEESSKFEAFKMDAERYLDCILAGIIELDADREHDGPSAPV